MEEVLIVEDNIDVRNSLAKILTSRGYSPIETSDGKSALELFRKITPAAVLLDLNLPDSNGIEILQKMKSINPDIEVIIVTGVGDIEVAVSAIKFGAYDFIVKPAKADRISLTLKRAIEKAELGKNCKKLGGFLENQLETLLGRSSTIQQVIEQIRQVATSDFSVIIQGETGSGKNFIARIIHNLSSRSGRPFVSIDIGAIPESLVESELFGYEKGAFTGADKKKKGLFEISGSGTVLIDELQNISLLAQSKLLRVVEEKSFYPLGFTHPVEMKARIISSTNADIAQSVREKKFREDLFFRLGDFMIKVPPLRERIEDVPFLAEMFFREAAEELNRQMHEISGEAMSLLTGYSWPGNIRELKNIIRRAALLSADGIVRPENIQFLIKEPSVITPMLPLKELSGIAVRDTETKAILQALRLTQGNKTKAAALLKIDYKTFFRKLKEYEIKV